LVLRRMRVIVVILALAVLVVMMAVPAWAAAGNSLAPKNLKVAPPASSAGESLKLTWDVEEFSALSGYRIFRSANPDSGFSLAFEDTVDAAGSGPMQYFDVGLEPGTTYYYRVALTGRDGTQGGSAVARAKLPARKRGSAAYVGKRIVISTADQTIYFLENEVLVKSHLCSTGVGSHPTPYGVFKVEYHDPAAVSVKYGNVVLYWWMGFAPDTGMHTIPYDPKTGEYYGGDSLGSPASHGCVRQSKADAKWAYDWAPNGTRIDVIGWHFEYTPTPPPPPQPPSITGGHASQGITTPALKWYLAEGCTSGSFDEYVLMMNPNPDAATVNASYMKPDGSVIGGSYNVPRFSRYTVHVDDISGLENTEVSTTLESDRPIVAERSMYFDYNGKLGGSDSVGVTAPAKKWYLAEGYTGGDFDEFVLVQNPGEVDGSVHVVYMRSDGQNFMRDYGIKAHSRLSLHVDDVPELANAEVSTWVTGTQPVIVERAQYFNYNGRDDGNASVGVTQPSKTWYIAEGYTGGQFDEYVLIMNPGDSQAFAHVTFMRKDGKDFAMDYTLKPHSRYTIHVDEIPEVSNGDVSTLVEADTPVIAERAMYFDFYGIPGGSDAPGVPEPGKYWYLAEGCTIGQYDTYVLIMNPNDKQVSVDVNYLVEGGDIKVAGYTLEPRSRYTVHVDTIPGMENVSFSTTLTGSEPIICERAMYFSIPRSN